MKKIFPIVVRPVNRFGVPARRRLMPAVERGKVNQAQVKLSNFWCQLVILLACNRHFHSLLEPSHKADAFF
jgi:muramidase (phage lysozyme)